MKDLLGLFRHVKIDSYEKGEIILRKGETQKKIFFIKKGLIRGYMMNEKYCEITFQLYPEYHIFGNIYAILFDEPSKFSFQALEATKVYEVDYNSFIKVTSRNPNLTELSRRFVGKKMMKQAFQRVESFVLLSPEERYLKYMNDYPNVINRAPDKYIANVLGITPVSLSRIKGRIASKKIY